MGQWQESLNVCQQELDVAIESSFSTLFLQARVDFGNTYRSMGEWNKVIEECETAWNMSPSGFFIPLVVTPLGDAYCKTGQLDKGIDFMERWKDYAVQYGAIVECEYCLPLAEGYLAKGNRDKAREHLTRAAVIFEELGTTRYLEWTQEALANITRLTQSYVLS